MPQDQLSNIINTIIPYILIAAGIFIFRKPIFGFLGWIGGFLGGAKDWMSTKKEKTIGRGLDFE